MYVYRLNAYVQYQRYMALDKCIPSVSLSSSVQLYRQENRGFLFGGQNVGG